MKPKILIGLPTMGSIHTLLAVTVLAWVSQAVQTGKYNISVYPTLNVVPVDNARNEIVKEFLKSDCTHLLFVDADTLPPIGGIEKLLAMNVPIASGITPIVELDEKNEPWRKWNCVDMNDQHVQPNTGIVEIKGAGGSCLMIQRQVLEKMPFPWFRFTYQDDNGKKTLNGDPLIISEDIFFVSMARGAGFKAYADTSLIARHSKAIIF